MNYPFFPGCIETDDEKFALGVARTHFPKLHIRDVEPIAKTFQNVLDTILLPNVIFVGDISLHVCSQDATNLQFDFFQAEGSLVIERVSPAGGMFYESSVFPVSCHGAVVSDLGANTADFALTFNGFALYTDLQTQNP